MIYLTSFQEMEKIDRPNIFSVARWKPKGCEYEELDYLAPQIKGKKLTGFDSPRKFYRKYLNAVLKVNRFEKLVEFLEKTRHHEIAMCCWCNIKQQKKKGYESIMCHTIPLGWLIKSLGYQVGFNRERYDYGIDYKGALK